MKTAWDVEHDLFAMNLRQPRYPKPHVMRQAGLWYLVDLESGTWQQREPITCDPRKWVAT